MKPLAAAQPGDGASKGPTSNRLSRHEVIGSQPGGTEIMRCTRTQQIVDTVGFDRAGGGNCLDFAPPYADALTPQPQSRSDNAMKVRGMPARIVTFANLLSNRFNPLGLSRPTLQSPFRPFAAARHILPLYLLAGASPTRPRPQRVAGDQFRQGGARPDACQISQIRQDPDHKRPLKSFRRSLKKMNVERPARMPQQFRISKGASCEWRRSRRCSGKSMRMPLDDIKSGWRKTE